MTLPLPNLDDRRWADLVEEARALIPFYAPEWTDHNVHDPGITLLELYAWIAEMDIYQINQVSDAHRRKLLALAGVRPAPPRPAQTVLQFKVKPPGRLALPAGVIVEGNDAFDVPTRFRTLNPLTVVTAEIKSIWYKTGQAAVDLMRRLTVLGEPVQLLGDDPGPGTALYFGFNEDLPVPVEIAFDVPPPPTHCHTKKQDPNTVIAPPPLVTLQVPVPVPTTLFFVFNPDFPAGDAVRSALLDELRASQVACGAPGGLAACDGKGEDEGDRRADCADKPEGLVVRDNKGKPYCVGKPEIVLAHHSVRTVWEFLAEGGRWRKLDPTAGEVEDHTRGFTLNGPVIVRLPAQMAQARLGPADQPLYYLRCRVIAGSFDAPPKLYSVALNGVRAEQAVPPVVPDGPAKNITGPCQTDFMPLGQGDGTPLQAFHTGSDPDSVPAIPVLECGFIVYTSENDDWHPWSLRSDFDASRRSDAHFVLDATAGQVTFGDGERGRVVPSGAGVYASFLETRAEAGNVAAGTRFAIVNRPPKPAVFDALPNPALTDAPEFSIVNAWNRLPATPVTEPPPITNPLPAVGGAAAETVLHAEGRALELRNAVKRAVTPADFETLAFQTPGVQLARASARANVYAPLPCLKATGIVTVIIVPSLPADRPMPSWGLRQAVAAYLNARRVIGTRVEVVGPTYREVAVRAKVQSFTGTRPGVVGDQVVKALDNFLHAIRGGPDGKGWPFGRDVYRSEIMAVIDGVQGVDHVVELELTADGGEPQCGNVCIGPIGLVVAGRHQIEVV